jgi:quercetin dioxygenase-like cupin family protein
MDQDPTTTNPGLYKLIFENERIRVLEYKDKPGDKTTPHRHPDSVMYTLSTFKRRVAAGARQVDVELQAGQVRWVGAQEHSGENIGDTDTHTIFVELKEPPVSGSPTPGSPLGPSTT